MVKFTGVCNKYNKKANHYFVIGPYDHWGGQRFASPNLMGYDIDSVANINMLDLAFQWLDYILKGKPKPELLQDKVNYQVMGTNKWKHSPSLKEMNNDTLTFYLSNVKSTDNYTLSEEKPKTNNYLTQKVYFKDRESQNNYYTPTIIFDTLDISYGLVFKPSQKQSIPFGNTRLISKQISKGSRLVILLNINKHPFEIINYGSGKEVADETIKDAGEPLQIKWFNDSFIRIPIWKN